MDKLNLTEKDDMKKSRLKSKIKTFGPQMTYSNASKSVLLSQIIFRGWKDKFCGSMHVTLPARQFMLSSKTSETHKVNTKLGKLKRPSSVSFVIEINFFEETFPLFLLVG